ncbi:MAG TPA: DUF1552 domain-containing protein, partial [Myxococcota bacterium]
EERRIQEDPQGERMSFNPRLNRRNLLAASGLLAGSMLLPSRRARATLAGPPPPPKRLVIFFTQHGTVYPNWNMRPAGNTGAADFTLDLSSLAESDFSQILQPLYALRDKLLVVDGLSMATAEGDVIGNNHNIGTRHALTASKLRSDGTAGGISIDQAIANVIKAQGRVDSLELSILGAANGGAVWRAAGQAMPADTDPASVWSRVFPPGVSGPPTSDAVRVQNAQASVLDVVRGEYDALAPRLATADRQKLQLHRDLVQDMESRLTQLATVQCTPPGSPSVSGTYGTAPYYDTRCDAMLNMVAAALACDLTRVVTLQMGQLSCDQIGAPPGDVHADYAHHQNDNATAKQMMTNYGRVHATQFAQLLALLDAIPEGSGTVLDSCAVVWCGELADGVHDLRPWPVVIGGGAMAHGKYEYFAPNTPNPSTGTTFPGYESVIGPPHNKLWSTVATALGAPMSSFGEAQLTTPDGQLVDCTGTFPTLLA